MDTKPIEAPLAPEAEDSKSPPWGKIPDIRMPTEAELRATGLRWYERAGFTFLDQWTDGLRALSMPSHRIGLSKDDVRLLLDAFDCGREDKAFLAALSERIDSACDWHNRFVRLNTRSPKDSAWPGLPITCAGRQAISWLLSSERALDDLVQLQNADKPAFIYLREVAFIPEEWELRCFIKDGVMIAATQYHAKAVNQMWQAEEGRTKTWDAVRRFYDTEVRRHVPRDTFVLDLYPGEDDWRVLEINPYGSSDPILFGNYRAVEDEAGFRVPPPPLCPAGEGIDREAENRPRPQHPAHRNGQEHRDDHARPAVDRGHLAAPAPEASRTARATTVRPRAP